MWSGPPDPDFANYLSFDGATAAPTESATFDAVAGTTYYVSVHGFDQSAEPSGAYTLSIEIE